MIDMHSHVKENDYIGLRLQSDTLKIVKIVPDSIVQLGKFGSFPSNQIISRPYLYTYEVLDAPDDGGNVLRVVPATELHAEALISEGSGEADGEPAEVDLSGSDETPSRTNREILDDASSQKLTMQEIEELKKQSSRAGKDIIAKILEGHSALDQKTAFSLAKYKLRKQKKFLKRFTVLPLDVCLLTEYMLETKDAPRVLELRDEAIGLMACYANWHHNGNTEAENALTSTSNGRYLVIDDTGGLVVAALAEKLGLLYGRPYNQYESEEDSESDDPDGDDVGTETHGTSDDSFQNPQVHAMGANGNTITVIHAHTQANLSLLKYFNYDTNNPDPSHPLFTHLKTLSWLQLLDPEADPVYAEKPEELDAETLERMKSGKRGSYYRKMQRWTRVQKVVNDTRAGGFDGLVVASPMDSVSIMNHTVPLLAGSAPVVVYSPSIEPLVTLADYYSTTRRTAYINAKQEMEERKRQSSDSLSQQFDEPVNGAQQPNHLKDFAPEFASDFPVDPTLLLAPSIQTSRIRQWQVLPGRTHPLMSSRGGAEGYIFHAVRVLPSQDRISARGVNSRKKRKLDVADAPGTGTSTPGE